MRDIIYDDVIRQYCNPTLIKKGGQRVVFKIDHPKFGESVIKIGHYKTPTNQDGWDIERIQREIDFLRETNSPYYPKNYDFQKINSDRYIIIEEFVDSIPLSDCINNFSNPLDALQFIRHLIIGLNIIWGKKIVHRDLKPDNILTMKNNLPKIIDLGIARFLDCDSITKTFNCGPLSRDYAAPEQYQYNKKLIDWRTDQYNLGIILMQMLLNGIHPFNPTLVGGQSIPQNILSDNWYKDAFQKKPITSIFPITTKMLGFHLHQRYKTPRQLLDEIETCLRSFS